MDSITLVLWLVNALVNLFSKNQDTVHEVTENDARARMKS
jgi:hypothetical protein